MNQAQLPYVWAEAAILPETKYERRYCRKASKIIFIGNLGHINGTAQHWNLSTFFLFPVHARTMYRVRYVPLTSYFFRLGSDFVAFIPIPPSFLIADSHTQMIQDMIGIPAEVVVDNFFMIIYIWYDIYIRPTKGT